MSHTKEIASPRIVDNTFKVDGHFVDGENVSHRISAQSNDILTAGVTERI